MITTATICYDSDREIIEWIEWLSSFGKTQSDGVTRLLYSKEWLAAQNALANKMQEHGLNSYFDSVGNLFGRLQGTNDAKDVILTGSHIDTVKDGGKYDGAFGVIASLLAVSRLYKLYGLPKKTIEVVSLCEEEGSRFPLTFWGSRNIKGVYSNDTIQSLHDSEGISFVEAMQTCGFTDYPSQSPKRTDISHFVELHIEQGQVLERNNKQIGIVSHIVGQKRFNIIVNGESNHAGTTPMFYRKDALATAAYLIHYLTKSALEVDESLVATVGKISSVPNMPNVIAGQAEFTLDIRHHDERVIQAYCERIFSEFKRVEQNSAMCIELSQWMDVAPIAMHTQTNEWLEQLMLSKQIDYQYIVSGAGHDSQVFGSMCPTSLIFIPSKDGISHSPKEYTAPVYLQKGIEILMDLLYKLAY